MGGSPDAQGYKDAVGALFSVAYALKFASKRDLGMDYTVMPLEALWWADDLTVFTGVTNKDAWQWRALILQPDHITRELVEKAISDAARKKDLPALPRLRFETYHEGLSAQILHIGPYADEAPTLKRLHQDYIPQHSLVETGHHHEIYLGDPNRTAPEKLKTILRQPVKRK